MNETFVLYVHSCNHIHVGQEGRHNWDTVYKVLFHTWNSTPRSVPVSWYHMEVPLCSVV